MLYSYCYQSIHLKPQRDKSVDNHKQSYHVTNDGNYLMAIYEGKDAKGKIKRDFEIVNNLKAGEYFKHSVQRILSPQGVKNLEGLVPEFKEAGKLQLPLKCVIKTGTMVILWENSPEEVWDLEQVERSKRLYKVVGMSSLTIQDKYTYGTITLKYHQESIPTSELKIRKGVYKQEEEFHSFRMFYHSQFNVLVEGKDFCLNILGQIEKIQMQ